ncbi:MAG: hypothetical protein ABI665_22840 [Vicinamibacterales bacterium]
MAADPELKLPTPASRWETFLWPRWLPVRARLPLIAQVTGAVAVTALFVGPWWARVPLAPAAPPSSVVLQPPAVPPPAAVPPPSAVPQAPVVPEAPARPAHLNLDVRHTFGSVDFSVTVDGKPALDTTLAGSGKRFKMFGKRAERSYTRTLDLSPGVRVVGVRVRSDADKFDQTRVERFDLGSASVAALQITADDSGLSVVAERPPAPPRRRAPAPAAPPAAVAAPVLAPPPAALPATPPAQQEANAVVDLLHSIRSMLIAVAGFVASTATGFLVQEFLRTRKALIFAQAAGASAGLVDRGERRRRRRSPKAPSE